MRASAAVPDGHQFRFNFTTGSSDDVSSKTDRHETIGTDIPTGVHTDTCTMISSVTASSTTSSTGSGISSSRPTECDIDTTSGQINSQTSSVNSGSKLCFTMSTHGTPFLFNFDLETSEPCV